MYEDRIELATVEKTVLELDPMRRVVATTMMRITATITAYSAMSWPSSHERAVGDHKPIKTYHRVDVISEITLFIVIRSSSKPP